MPCRAVHGRTDTVRVSTGACAPIGRFALQIACRATDELLNGEVFYSLREAQTIFDSWRKHYNTKRHHSALGYRPPAPEAIVPMDQRPTMHRLSIWTTQVRPLTASSTSVPFCTGRECRQRGRLLQHCTRRSVDWFGPSLKVNRSERRLDAAAHPRSGRSPKFPSPDSAAHV